ncbi:cytochrome c maturation protein CcmE [Azospirillum sp. TSO35-2]|uniref:cytochrome c maturation protein CcmE domain-containing protein n=1 Tax=Azospirillum sp. TSO35-2 TaxID=716796 RepID=UPI000D60B326|nr:cytochrome c maturation protein CcmE [Azospirillum sp. TSO35-2]PWC36050.1 hypothetical protein TSO352_12835 [Azospirillum sp. TSO35-2]
MLKVLTVAALAALTMTGAARAEGHRHAAAFQPTSPQPIADVLKAGGGTVTGTVGKVAANWFVLADGGNQIEVASHGFLPEGLQSGDQVTVVGGVRQGALQAGQIIRQDGTAFGRDAVQDRGGRRHGRDHGRDHDDD